MLLAEGYTVAARDYRSRDYDPQYKSCLQDCLAVVSHMKGRPFVDPKSIVVYGCSGGGDLALEVAAAAEVCAVVPEDAIVLSTLRPHETENIGVDGDYACTCEDGLAISRSGMRIRVRPLIVFCATVARTRWSIRWTIKTYRSAILMSAVRRAQLTGNARATDVAGDDPRGGCPDSCWYGSPIFQPTRPD